MDEKNVFYRAFLEYKKRTAKDKKIQKLCEAITGASTDGDALESVRTYCIIDEDWIEIIEKGMEYVEKAIREERQFIRKEGEVVPIEKLKRVSTTTVQHLARHSELITKEPEDGKTIIPERLYMAENLSDYTVYENRFLYMLLCYTRDFISVRLDKILELGRTYRMHTEISKNVRVGRQHLKYKESLYFEDKNDPMADEFFRSEPLIARIETMQRLVVSLLLTPLMKEVSKAPMVQPPITRTNVLRMNVNFKAALEMYGKLSAYTKLGYSIEEIKNNYRPLPEAFLGELAETVALEKFLSYKYGNKLSDRLRAEYEEEEKQLRERELAERQMKIEALKRRIEEEGISPYEYMLLLEEQNRQREKDSADLRVARKQIEHLNEKIESQNNEILALNDRVEKLTETVAEKEKEIADWEVRFVEETTRMQREFEEEKERIFTEHEEEKARLLKEYEEETARITAECEEAKEQARLDYENRKQEVETRCEEEISAMRITLEEGQAALASRSAELEEEHERILSERTLMQAQLHGLRQQHGLITDEEDFTSKERFMELEAEFKAFEQLFETQWKYTKKRIRKEILGKKPKA